MSEPIPPLASSTVEYYRPLPVPAEPAPRQRYWLHALLLLLTCFTTLVMGARMQYNFNHNQPALSFADERLSYFPASWLFKDPACFLVVCLLRLPFCCFLWPTKWVTTCAAAVMGFTRRFPFFIPMPTMIGTMGAVILIRSKIRSRTALFDVGIAGPIAGFIVGLAVLVVSLAWSKPMTGLPEYEIRYPLIFSMVQHFLAWMHPGSAIAALPLNRVFLHPAAIAAWVGMFATSLNLLPGGQLDGGHIVYAISPRAHRMISGLTILVLLPMAYYFWVGWWLWAILLQVSSLRHPQVAEWPRVSGARAWLAGLALLMLVLTLVPAPFAHASTPEFGHGLIESARDALHQWRGRWFAARTRCRHSA